MDVSSVSIVGTLADLFSRTSAPLLFVWSRSRSARGVGAAGINHSYCESEGDGCSRVLYWFTPTFLEVQRGFWHHDKKEERHPIKSPTLTEFDHLVRCGSCLEPPHCAARLSKRWDQVGGWQDSLCSLITNDYEEGASWSISSVDEGGSIAPNDTAFGMICPRVKISAAQVGSCETYQYSGNTARRPLTIWSVPEGISQVKPLVEQAAMPATFIGNIDIIFLVGRQRRHSYISTRGW